MRMTPIFRVSLQALLTGRRWLLVLALAALYVALALILATTTSGDHAQQYVSLFLDLVLPFMVPFIALLFASDALGAEVEDRTIVFLTLRPLPAWEIVLPKFAAAALVTLAATWTPLVIGFLLLAAGEAGLLPAALAASGLGAVAYCAIFLLLGLIQRRALLIGAIYILLWEGAIAALSTGAAHLSVRFYALGVFVGMMNRKDLLPSGLASPAAEGAALFLAVVTVAAAAQTAYRLRRVQLQ
ncbi:MAG TPA: ABC transporter permease subunit, partial [Dehalococcoidia bacterium]|nr:ABC transporter permease subunit [Dehalococcoidia bacterium]